MKVSSRGRYGLKLLLSLSRETCYATVASIAERNGISARYLEHVAVILRRAGLIRSSKGSGGGYTLSRPPGEITLAEALSALEGDLLITDPPSADETRLSRCVRETVFDKINSNTASIMAQETLLSLLERENENMYFI